MAVRNIREANLYHRIKLIKGKSSEVGLKLLREIPAIDILFIDGDHFYKGVLLDYNLYHMKLRKGGYIIFHDIYPKQCGWWGPRIIIDCLKRKAFFKKGYDIIEIDTQDGYGVAICKKLIRGKYKIKDNYIMENLRKAIAFLKYDGNFKKGIKCFINSLTS